MSFVDSLAAVVPLLWWLFVVVVVVLLWSTGALSRLIASISEFSGFGLSFKFDAASAAKTQQTVEQQLGAVQQKIIRAIEDDVRRKAITDGFNKMLAELGFDEDVQFRATIHIPDPLYVDCLYQLIDYCPGGNAKGQGHGRTFSTRTGIIGLAWRIDRNKKWTHTSAITQQQMMQEWGMTTSEAANRRAKDSSKAMLAVVVHRPSSGTKLGVVYLDSTNKDTFGGDEAGLEQKMVAIQTKFEERLAGALEQIVENALERSPQLRLISS